MKMQKNQSMELVNQWEGGEVCWGRDFVMTWPRRSRYHGIKFWLVVLFVVVSIFKKNLILSECHSTI